MPADNTAADDRPALTAGIFRRGLAREWALFRQPKVLLAACALVFVPALYVLIYVSSVWDPYGNLPNLPAALVNQDRPVTKSGRELNLGTQIVGTLRQQPPFRWVDYASADDAKADVRAGKVFFALSIPSDLSQRALASNQPAKIGLYVSEGGNYTAALVSKRFGAELAHSVNEKLNRERWTSVVGDDDAPATITLGDGLAALRTGAHELADGSAQLGAGIFQLEQGSAQTLAGGEKLADGAVQLAEGSSQLTGGFRQVTEAIVGIRIKLPTDAKLQELATGSATLMRGATDLNDGLSQLKKGAGRLDAGAGELDVGAAKVPFVGGRLSAGTTQLHAGISTLGAGIERAAAGTRQLDDGMKQLNAGVAPLALGLVELNAGLRTMSEKLPNTEQLALYDRSITQLREGTQSLSSGLGDVHRGASRLQKGAEVLVRGASSLSKGLDEAAAKFEEGLGGSHASHLAASVETVVEVVSPVPQNGPAFAPYFASLSLWIGAVMMSFVFYLRRLPAFLQAGSRPVRWLVKALPLFALGLLQATTVVGLLKFGLGIRMENALSVWLIALLGSATFVSLVLLFISVLGDAGRLLAVVALIFQLAASGGIYPVELSSPLYQSVHAYLPFTFLVHAFRAALFSAFDGHWGADAVRLGGVAAAAIVLGMLLARWKYLAEENYGPAVEL